MNGVQLIAAERTRQIEDEKWSAKHDDEHDSHELAKAAMSYIAAVANHDEWAAEHNAPPDPTDDWPWDEVWWKPSSDPIRNLVKSGALIAAEIDRLQRKSQNDKAQARRASRVGFDPRRNPDGACSAVVLRSRAYDSRTRCSQKPVANAMAIPILANA